jgi:mannitol-1-/sugar-/sorbitol-6-/2-deoxyglucose-6-phosphatase
MANAPRPNVRAVIFDMDGLLVDSEPFWRRVEAAVFADLGADIGPYLGHGHTMGLRVDEAIAYLCRAVGLVDHDESEIAATVVAGVIDAINSEAELLPGVLEVLDRCAAAGLVLCLASGSTPPVIDAVLDRFALRSHFVDVFSAIDDLYGKPNPAIFLRAAATLGVEPTECAVFEDSLNGCIAAKAARMVTIAVPNPDDADDPRYTICDAVCSSLTDALEEPVASLLGLETAVVNRR